MTSRFRIRERELARLNYDAYVPSSSPGGGTEGKVCRLRFRLEFLPRDDMLCPCDKLSIPLSQAVFYQNVLNVSSNKRNSWGTDAAGLYKIPTGSTRTSVTNTRGVEKSHYARNS